MIVLATTSGATLMETQAGAARCAGTTVNGYCITPGANLKHANLAGADLRHANLNIANLTRSNLASADLTDAILSGAVLKGANLGGANLESADLSGVDLTLAKLRGADLSEVVSGGISGTPTSLPTGWQLIDGSLVGP